MTALAAAAEANISMLAHSDRLCCRPWTEMIAGIRYAAIAIRIAPREYSAMVEIFLFRGMVDRAMTAAGKRMSTISVIMSDTPMVKSWANPVRHFGPGSGTTCQ